MINGIALCFQFVFLLFTGRPTKTTYHLTGVISYGTNSATIVTFQTFQKTEILRLDSKQHYQI